LYLHSALVQTRQIAPTQAARRQALRYNLIDTAVALNSALFINAAILILSAAVFFRHGIAVHDLRDAHHLLTPLLGTHWAAVAFAVALWCAGQSSTITGTLAGQIVMEGFVHLRLSPALRRVLTRGLAVVPAVLVLAMAGEDGVLPLLIASQVVLSVQLPFAVVPLIRLTNHRPLMGRFANNVVVRCGAWLSAAGITALNGWLLARTIVEWQGAWPVLPLVIAVALGCGGLLVWITVIPLRCGESVPRHRMSRQEEHTASPGS
jgi:manganese transport protein